MQRIYLAVDRFAATEARPGGIDGIVALDPDRGDWRLLLETDGARQAPRLTRGGKRLTFLDAAGDPRLMILDHPWDGDPEPVARLSGYASFASPSSGDEVFVSLLGPEARSAGREGSWRIDTAGSDWARLPLPAGEPILDCSPDGEWLLIGDGTMKVVRPDGTACRDLSRPGDTCLRPRFSPDGRRVVYALASADGESLWVVDLDGVRRERIVAESPATLVARWSPDGSRLALKLCNCVRDGRGRLTVPNDPRLANPRIEVIDADGGNRRPVDLPPGWIRLGDWG